jgi:hypothetical protein
MMNRTCYMCKMVRYDGYTIVARDSYGGEHIIAAEQCGYYADSITGETLTEYIGHCIVDGVHMAVVFSEYYMTLHQVGETVVTQANGILDVISVGRPGESCWAI